MYKNWYVIIVVDYTNTLMISYINTNVIVVSGISLLLG